jgi:hypothetical protein
MGAGEVYNLTYDLENRLVAADEVVDVPEGDLVWSAVADQRCELFEIV